MDTKDVLKPLIVAIGLVVTMYVGSYLALRFTHRPAHLSSGGSWGFSTKKPLEMAAFYLYRPLLYGDQLLTGLKYSSYQYDDSLGE